MLKLAGLGKDYGERTAVVALDLETVPGEILGLLGPNGAGKTTTISMACGVVTPTRGTVEIGGVSLAREPRVAKQKLGLVPQDLALYEELSAVQNLRYFGALYGLRGAALAERIAWALGVVGLTDRAGDLVKTYSGGMKRRLNLAAGIIHKPGLLVLDEPTVGVDPQSRNHIFETVKQLRKDGATIIYTTHYMEEVEALCDRVAIMDAGKIVALGTIAELVGAHAGQGISVDVTGDIEAAMAAVLAHGTVERSGSRLAMCPPDRRAGDRGDRGLGRGDRTARVAARHARGGVPRDDRTCAARWSGVMLGAAIQKDVWLLLRDRGSLIRLFVVPILFISLFGSMFRSAGSDKGHARPIALWYADGDTRGQAIDNALAKTDGFVGRRLATPDAVRDSVAKDETVAGIVVAGLPVELVIDLETEIQTRGPIQGALTAIVTRALATGPVPPPVVEVRSPKGPARPEEISGFQITVPANSVLFGFFICITVALSFAGEKRTGTWRRVLAAPVPRWHALVGTLVPYYIIGLFQLAFLFGIGAGAFGMHVAGSLAALVVLSMTVVLVAVCLGLVFASLGGSERQIGGVGSMILLVMALLGGCMFPRMLMPDALKAVGHIVPHSWALDGYYAILTKPGTGIVEIAPSLLALLGFAAVFATFGLWRFKFEK